MSHDQEVSTPPPLSPQGETAAPQDETAAPSAETENSEVHELRALLRRKSEQVAELRSTLLETRRALNSKLEDARAEVRDLKRRLALHERRTRMKDVNALAHNREASMDDFFTANTDPEPYVRFGAALRLELKRLGIDLDGRTLADVGVGPGYALKELLRGSHPRNVYGFDFSAAAVEIARGELPGGRFEQRDIYDEPPGTFEVVLCTEVLEHLEQPARALRMLAQMVEPGGWLIVTVPDGRIDFSEKHVNFWSPESWTLFLRQTLPQHDIETRIFQPYPETGHQTNIGIVRKAARNSLAKD